MKLRKPINKRLRAYDKCDPNSADPKESRRKLLLTQTLHLRGHFGEEW